MEGDMAHVEVFRFKAQPGKRQNVIDSFSRWDREHKSKAKGFERSALVSGLDNPDEFVAIVRFDSTDSYNVNSSRPETDQWYQALRENLVADPKWLSGRLEVASEA
jgi:heme-degrading monooxygenase HmoA